MSETNIDDLLSKAKNKFILTNAVASRAKQVFEGSLPYIDHFDPSNPITTAMREIAADKIRFKVLSGPSAKPEELLIKEEFQPSALERLAREKKGKPKKEKKKRKSAK